jgi:hypothetical protein
MKRVAICSPIFWGDASGASVYYQLLTNELLSHGVDVTVISDKESSESACSVNYFPLFPARCAKDKRPFRDLLAYFWQNMSYFRLQRIINSVRPHFALVHSSFYNHPGIFAQVMKRVIHAHPEIKFIADVRDGLMPSRKVPLLNSYHQVIACSENVANHLLENGLDVKRLLRVPVIQERMESFDTLRKPLIASLGLEGQSYIFYGGLVKESKAVDILLEAFLRYVRPIRKDLRIVIAGLMKTSNGRIKEMLAMDGVLYVGNRRHEEILALMSGAALCVNLSPNEGMPRSSLEALALRRPVVLPPNIPEFARFCDAFVVADREPATVARRMIEIMEAGAVPNYPIEMHYPENVLNSYTELLSS